MNNDNDETGHKSIESSPLCRIYASASGRVSISSDNGLSPIRRQVII